MPSSTHKRSIPLPINAKLERALQSTRIRFAIPIKREEIHPILFEPVNYPFSYPSVRNNRRNNARFVPLVKIEQVLTKKAKQFKKKKKSSVIIDVVKVNKWLFLFYLFFFFLIHGILYNIL